MLVLKLEIWPGGDKKRAREIGRIDIGNISELAPVSNYSVYAEGETFMGPQRVYVVGHPRKEGAWALVRRVLKLLAFRGDINTNPPGLLCRCGGKGVEESHTCPYAEEIGGDSKTLCNCCEGCTHQCAMDI